MKNINVESNVIDLVLSLDTAQYASGDVLADTQELADAMRTAGGTGIIHSIVVQDDDDQAGALDIIILDSNTSIGTENDAVTMADNDNILGSVEVTAADYIDMANSQHACKTNLGTLIGLDMPGGYIGTKRTLLSAPSTYMDKVLSTQSGNLIGYWPMNEPSGTTAIDYSAEANNGAYTGVTLGQIGIGDGLTSTYFDGSDDLNDVYSSALNSDFDGGEGSLATWLKVNSASVWTDATNREAIFFYVDANNIIYLRKRSTNNVLRGLYTAGATGKTVDVTSVTDTGWIHLGVTWSASGDAFKLYYNGNQSGSTQTGLGTWAGNLKSDATRIGNSGGYGGSPWHGYLAHTALWKTPLSATQMLALATL
jgi:hypothetical protein